MDQIVTDTSARVSPIAPGPNGQSIQREGDTASEKQTTGMADLRCL